MRDLVCTSVIVKREMEEGFRTFFLENGVRTIMTLLCKGTASKSLLDLLGLEETGKVLLGAVMTREKAQWMLHNLVVRLGLNVPGNGVAFTVPMGSIAGQTTLNHLTSEQTTENSEVIPMPEEYKYDLLVAIANRGHAETVMEAARTAGAMGGTIIHAKGTNPDSANLFFGMSIADEKEMILILTAAVHKTQLMHAIMEKAGISSPAHTVLFSLPVDSVAGLKSVMEAAGDTL